jgi:hypothetical protein
MSRQNVQRDAANELDARQFERFLRSFLAIILHAKGDVDPVVREDARLLVKKR